LFGVAHFGLIFNELRRAYCVGARQFRRAPQYVLLGGQIDLSATTFRSSPSLRLFYLSASHSQLRERFGARSLVLADQARRDRVELGQFSLAGFDLSFEASQGVFEHSPVEFNKDVSATHFVAQPNPAATLPSSLLPRGAKMRNGGSMGRTRPVERTTTLAGVRAAQPAAAVIDNIKSHAAACAATGGRASIA
jgi:hypothetical protein